MKGMEAREKALIKPAELKQQCIDSGEKKSAAAALANSVLAAVAAAVVVLAHLVLLVVQWDCTVSWAGGV